MGSHSSDADDFDCPDCGMSAMEIDRVGCHKEGCPNPTKAKALLKTLFGDLLPIAESDDLILIPRK